MYTSLSHLFESRKESVAKNLETPALNVLLVEYFKKKGEKVKRILYRVRGYIERNPMNTIAAINCYVIGILLFTITRAEPRTLLSFICIVSVLPTIVPAYIAFNAASPKKY